jgi:hypothetical protein
MFLQATDTALQIESSFRDTLAYDLIIALITGLLAAALFFLALRIWKPRIKIGSKIVKTEKTDEKGNKTYIYTFKFINKTISNIENVSIDLFLMEDYFNGSAKNYKTKKLKIAQPNFNFLTGTRNKNKEIHNNCVQMSIKEPLEDLWNGEREWLHLQIDSTHSKSGRRAVNVKTYKDPLNTIVLGKFDSGDNFNII